jgi:nucleoside-diphosphate-sugar epimerase
MNILIIGGTRNIGYFLVQRLRDRGHRVTLLNRGITPDTLPQDIARLRCDRTDPQQLRRALGGRGFDAVIDNVLYKGPEAEAIVDILDGQVGHYIALSTGQVYLVREELQRPFKESDYEGPVMPMPEPFTYDHEEWLYGYEKRQAEDVLAQVWKSRQFPYTTLRMPMVNSERDTFHRLYSYILRIKDGGPILVPDTPDHPLRHIYANDVVTTILHLIESGQGKGCTYNISQDETLSLEAFLVELGKVMNREPRVTRFERDLLAANGFLPDCSPFSDLWMSELDNTLSKQELGIQYTPLPVYLQKIVEHYERNPPPTPISYRRRNAERQFAAANQGV